MLDAELSEAYAAWLDATPDVTWPRLERRGWLHELVPDPVADSRHRSAAIGVSTLTVVRVRNRSTTPSATRKSNPSVLKFVDDVADAVGAGEGDLGDLGTGMPWAASIVLLSGSLTQQGEL